MKKRQGFKNGNEENLNFILNITHLPKQSYTYDVDRCVGLQHFVTDILGCQRKRFKVKHFAYNIISKTRIENKHVINMCYVQSTM